MATASDSGQPGLERLMRLDRINVNQKGRGFKGNKYTVHSEGEVLFNLKEDGHALTFLAHGKNRGFHIDGVDNTGRKVFSLRRPGVFVTDKVELYMNEKLVCIVRKEATFMTPMFSINDANDSPTLRVKGEVTDYNFQVLLVKCSFSRMHFFEIWSAITGTVPQKYQHVLENILASLDEIENLDIRT